MIFSLGQAKTDVLGAREIDGSRPRQAQDGHMGDLKRVFAGFQRGVSDVVGREDLAAPDQRGDLLPVEERPGDQGT